MWMECVLKRKKGTTVELDGDVYKFVPDEEGNHVCAVEHQEHIEVLLGAPMNGAFQVYGKAAQDEYTWKQKEKAAESAKAAAKAAENDAVQAHRAAQDAAKELEAREKNIAKHRAEFDLKAQTKAEAAKEAKEKIEAGKAAQRESRKAQADPENKDD